MMRHFFISYSRQDYAVALRLKADLERRDFQIWLDRDRIQPGERWDDTIRDAIKDSLAVLYLASPASRASGIVADELEQASGAYHRPVLPLWITGDLHWAEVAITGYIRIQHVDLRGEKYAEGLEALISQLQRITSRTVVLPFMGEFEENTYEVPFTSAAFMQQPDKERLMDTDSRKSLPASWEKAWILRALKANISRLLDLFSSAPLHENEQDMVENVQPQPGVLPLHMMRNPYKGLRAFEYKDARDFFGRDKLVDRMIGQIGSILAEEKRESQSSRCMLVVSASGSGKSSTVLAGLLPALQKEAGIVQQEQKKVPEIERWLFLEPVRPGKEPITTGLIRALNRPFLNGKDVGPSPLERYESDALQFALSTGPLGLYELLQNITTNAHERIVLTIDQFEELFAPTVDVEQQQQFIELLFATATQPRSNVLVIATLRADFYDHILKNPQLFAIMNKHQVEIPPMNIHDLRAVIEEPAQLDDVGITFEQDLVGDLLYEVRKRPDALPLLQFTLAKLFDRREGRILTRHSYNEIGGLEGALNNHADATYYELPDKEHQAAAKVLFTHFFINVAEIRDNSYRPDAGEGVTSRRVTRAELRLDDPKKQRIREETLEAFTTARLLIVRNAATRGQSQEDTTYEVSHEVLLSAWKCLQRWIGEDLQDIYFLQRLRPRMKQWHNEGEKKKKFELLSASHELEQLQQYSLRNELNHDETEFLRKSQQRQKDLKLRGIAGNSILLLTTILLTLALAAIGYQRFGYLLPSSPSSTTVTSRNDSGPGSLREVLAQAPSGATITFSPQLRGERIQLLHDLNVSRAVTIQGLSDDSISISSGHTGTGITVASNAVVTFKDIKFADSYTHRLSLISNMGVLTLTDCRVTNNQSYGIGGGAITNYNMLTLDDTMVDHNTTSGNGGGIYNLFGILTVMNRSVVQYNIAYNSGGGIYSQGKHVELVNSDVSYNRAQLVQSAINNNYGGGIDVVDGSLNMFANTTISHNIAAYYGGGIALQGSQATINDSTIVANHAGKRGGGMIVTQNSDNYFTSFAVLGNIVVADQPKNAEYYIGQNTAAAKGENEIGGMSKTVGNTIQIVDNNADSVAISGNPPSRDALPPQSTPNYLGAAPLNGFCNDKNYSYGQIAANASKDAQKQDDIQVSCFTKDHKPGQIFLGETVCNFLFTGGTIMDRLSNYFDSSSLQCYRDLKLLGPIGNNPADFDAQCKRDTNNKGLYPNPSERTTAYSWSCQSKHANVLPLGLSVTDACALKYHIKNAIERLVNYEKPDGWACMEALPV